MDHLAIMYHYVQPKGMNGIVPLEPSDFEKQIEWVSKNYEIVSPDQMKQTKGHKPFCVLTFDDATKDQYEIAFDILKRKGIPAYFTVMSGPLSKGSIPVVHLVHSVLSYFSDREIWEELNSIYKFDKIPKLIGSYYSYEADEYRRYNKYAFNFALPNEISRAFLEQKLSSVIDLEKFVEKYYISLAEWREIIKSGMTIGVHAVDHREFNGDARMFYREEIAPCRNFLKENFGVIPKWYTPAFGGGPAYREMMKLLEPILLSEGFIGGFTTQHGYINQLDQFWLNRVDCVKLPPFTNRRFS